uniref:Uncharacterized protein n=1 Tax=Arundo donax TaxID=35708 RepID=A0A0A8ZHQ5_ARUDO
MDVESLLKNYLFRNGNAQMKSMYVCFCTRKLPKLSR